MTVNQLYRSFLSALESIYERSEAASITSIIFESVAGLSKAAIIKDPSRIPDEKISSRLHACLEELKMHKPVQYITGEAWFYKMKLKVSPAVLIPRPETEELVELMISHLKNKQTFSILDIGTGSGCIPVALKKELPRTDVTAIDISNDALDIAKANASEQKTNINFMQVDFLDESEWPALASFDVIVSNPPYIPENEKQMLDKNVTAFEPYLALFVKNEQPLLFYEKIADFGRSHLKRGGMIFLETHEQYAEATAALFSNDHYSSEIKKDMQGKQRMVMATHHYP